MKKFFVALALTLVGCSATAAPSMAPTASAELPRMTAAASHATPSPSVDPYPIVCQAAKSGVKHVTSEALLMLKAHAATLADPNDAAAQAALGNHMTALHNYSNWTLRDLPKGLADRRIANISDALKTMRDLVQTRGWTSKQISDMSIELVDAATELGDC